MERRIEKVKSNVGGEREQNVMRGGGENKKEEMWRERERERERENFCLMVLNSYLHTVKRLNRNEPEKPNPKCTFI